MHVSGLENFDSETCRLNHISSQVLRSSFNTSVLYLLLPLFYCLCWEHSEQSINVENPMRSLVWSPWTDTQQQLLNGGCGGGGAAGPASRALGGARRSPFLLELLGHVGGSALSVWWRCGFWCPSLTGLSRPLVSALTLGQSGLQAAPPQAELLQSLQGTLRGPGVAVVQEGPALSALPGQPQRGGVPLPEDALQLADAQVGGNTPQVHRGDARRRGFTATFLWTLLHPGPSSPPLPPLFTCPVLSSAVLWLLSASLSQLGSFPVSGRSLRILACFRPRCATAAAFAALCCVGRSTQSYVLPGLFFQSTQPPQDGDPLQLLFVQLRRHRPGSAQ